MISNTALVAAAALGLFLCQQRLLHLSEARQRAARDKES
jgi:hypothetical protein